MKISKYFILLLLMGGCTGEMAKRTTYETLENVRMNQCDKEISANCPGREGYDDYTRKRNDVVK